MINDRIQVKLNGVNYNAKMDFMCLANAQYYLSKIHEKPQKITIPQIFEGINEGDWTILSTVLVEAILRCHSNLKREMVWENMKYAERDTIVEGVVNLIIASMPQEDEDKKKVEEDNPKEE